MFRFNEKNKEWYCTNYLLLMKIFYVNKQSFHSIQQNVFTWGGHSVEVRPFLSVCSLFCFVLIVNIYTFYIAAIASNWKCENVLNCESQSEAFLWKNFSIISKYTTQKNLNAAVLNFYLLLLLLFGCCWLFPICFLIPFNEHSCCVIQHCLLFTEHALNLLF